MNTNEPQDDSNQSVPVEVDRNKIAKVLKARFGIERDELDTLYPKDDQLQEFYIEALAAGEMDTGAEDEKGVKKDAYALSKAEKGVLKEIELLQKRLERAKFRKKAKQAKKVAQKEAAEEPVTITATEKELDAAVEHLPPEERPTEADKKSVQDLLKDLENE